MAVSYTMPKRRDFKDITGQRFGRLIPTKLLGARDGRIWWLCRCDCGTIDNIAEGSKLRKGAKRSCGCLIVEHGREMFRRLNPIKDMAGMRFGRLLVTKFLRVEPQKGAYWECVCDCGKTCESHGTLLRNKSKQSCGCGVAIKRRGRFGKINDWAGRRFGKLVAIKPRPRHRAGEFVYWICKCDCGTTTEIYAGRLASLRAKSCGCLTCRKYSTRHKTSETTEYTIWSGMKMRCHNKHNPSFHHYGGRGIKVCDRWRESFVNFLADMGKRPSMQHSLDRIDVNGDYCPENCRWATNKEQGRNKRVNRLLTAFGETRTLTEWAEIKCVRTSTIYSRLNSGWTVEDAISTPVQQYPEHLRRREELLMLGPGSAHPDLLPSC